MDFKIIHHVESKLTISRQKTKNDQNTNNRLQKTDGVTQILPTTKLVSGAPEWIHRVANVSINSAKKLLKKCQWSRQ